jgi:hypothetical protein
MSYDTWQDALAGIVKEQGLERQELGEISRRALAIGSTNSHGTVGAHGRLTSVSEILAQAQIDVCTTPDDGLNTYQGQALGISSPSKEERGVGFTLTVFFDSKTASRLNEDLCSPVGKNATDGTECFPMIMTLVRPTT